MMTTTTAKVPGKVRANVKLCAENGKRAQRVAQAMKTSPLYDWKTERDCAVIDLLTDLQHFCDARRFDFMDCLRIATDHYSVEGGLRPIGSLNAYLAQYRADRERGDD